ncbi:MAG: DUF4292 domain-containing protein [Prevotella sp.]|nr:DUF4292 domain-containing protein [Prevotella sp.]
MRKSHIILLALPCLLWACGTTKQAVNNAGQKQETVSTVAKQKEVTGKQNATATSLSFVQKVSDNSVYAQNIVSSMTFSIKAGNKDISAPGSLRMRKDKMIRLQLFVPIIGTEVGRIDFTPDYVLVVDRLHKQYVKGGYNDIDFLRNNGLDFYSLQSLFWNQLLLPGTKKVGEMDLQKFSANLDGTGQYVPVSIKYNNLSFVWKAARTTGLINQAKVVYSSAANGSSTLTWDYSNFKSVGAKMFPATQVFAFESKQMQKVSAVTVTLEMDNIQTTSGWDSETTLSSKYKQVDAKQALSTLLSM